MGRAPRPRIDTYRQHRRQLEPENVLVGDIVADIERSLASGMRQQRPQCIALMWRIAWNEIEHAIAMDQARPGNELRRAFLDQPKRGLARLRLPIVKCDGIGFVLARDARDRAPPLIVSPEHFEPFAAITRIRSGRGFETGNSFGAVIADQVPRGK